MVPLGAKLQVGNSKIKIIIFFFQKRLHNSKKSSTFALDF